tara:strand:- start:2470 stop:2775 length:306 start_codon:yes stop_codon:yes gene_type:complete
MSISTVIAIDDTGTFPSGGFQYSGRQKTFAFRSGTWPANTVVKIQASLGDGVAGSWIPLTDSEGNEIQISENGILNISVGQCKLKFVVTSDGTPNIDVRIT